MRILSFFIGLILGYVTGWIIHAAVKITQQEKRIKDLEAIIRTIKNEG